MFVSGILKSSDEVTGVLQVEITNHLHSVREGSRQTLSEMVGSYSHRSARLCTSHERKQSFHECYGNT